MDPEKTPYMSYNNGAKIQAQPVQAVMQPGQPMTMVQPAYVTVPGQQPIVVGQQPVVVGQQPQVVVVQAQANPYRAGELGQQSVMNADGSPISLLPPAKLQGMWNYGFCDRCCSCDGTCAMAWLCSCIPVAQMAEKMKRVGFPSCGGGFQTVVSTVIMFVIIEIIVYVSLGIDLHMAEIFLFVVLCQLRGIVRNVFQIPGSGCEDCVVSYFCAPCTITQLAGQLWSDPTQNPGCTCDDSPAGVV